MKSIFLLLIGAVLFSCSTQKVLKTDTQEAIDLSGRWNNTDAEIASSELFNNLLTSVWLKKYQADNELNARIEILEFDSNFKEGGEELVKYFAQSIEAHSSLELIGKDSDKLPEFFLNGKITAKENKSEKDNFIDYTLFSQLKNSKGEIQWEDSMTVKKYLKE